MGVAEAGAAAGPAAVAVLVAVAVAAGSTSEVLVGLRGSVGWGYFSPEELAPAAAKLDRLLASLWKLTH